MAEEQQQPFEKIRSMVEKRGIFTLALQEKAEFICKVTAEELLVFRPVTMDREKLVGTAGEMFSEQGSVNAIGNFSAGPDRYFFCGDIGILGNSITLNFTIDLFKLERRQTMRVNVSERDRVSLNVTEINGKPCLREAVIMDISAGGFRFYFPDEGTGLVLEKDGKTKGVLHLPSTKTIEFSADVKHVRAVDEKGSSRRYYGMQFVEAKGVANRIMGLVMEIQRRAVNG